MSLFDRRTPRRARAHTWNGLAPPPITFHEIWSDLRWHAALYRQDKLALSSRIGFLALRVVQRISYNAGWRLGGRR